MGFYLKKIEEYNSKPSHLKIGERMAAVKSKVEADAKAKYDHAIQSYNFALKTNVFGGGIMGANGQFATAVAYQNILEENRAEYEAIASLTPGEYFCKLAVEEYDSIREYTESRAGSLVKDLRKISKANNNNLGNGIRSLFCDSNDRLNQLVWQRDVHNEQVTVGQEAIAEWESLSNVQRVEYLVGRYEQEGTTELDEKGLDALGESRLVENILKKETDKIIDEEGESAEQGSTEITNLQGQNTEQQ